MFPSRSSVVFHSLVTHVLPASLFLKQADEFGPVQNTCLWEVGKMDEPEFRVGFAVGFVCFFQFICP